MLGAAGKARRLIGNALLRPWSSRVVRRDDLWLFGHQHGAFAGNAKFLYLWLLAHRPDLAPLWVTSRADVERFMRDRDLPVCRAGSLAGVRAALSAGVYLYCHGPEDVSVALGGGALHVNLWHGVGLKAIQYGDPRSNASKYANADIGWARRIYGLGSRIDPDLLITTSPFTADHFARQFRLPQDRCPPCGYPRLDVPLDPQLAALVVRVDGDPGARLRRGAKEVHVYAPTFRDSARDFLTDALPDRAGLEARLTARGALLYLKLHPHTSVPADWADGSVRLWPAEIDLYSCMDSIDCLITDYSSLHYDWLFHSDRGAILYIFDADDYAGVDRALLYPFAENVAGWIARSFGELVELIATGRAFEPHPNWAQIRRKFWGDLEGPASTRVVAAIEQQLQRRGKAEGSVVGPRAGSER